MTVVQAHNTQLNVKPRLFAELNAKFQGKLRVHVLYSASREEAARLRDCFKYKRKTFCVYQTVPQSWRVKELKALNLYTVYRQSNWYKTVCHETTYS